MLFFEYKGFLGNAVYDAEDDLWHGEILGIPDTVAYHAKKKEEAQKAFSYAVEGFLLMCDELKRSTLTSDYLYVRKGNEAHYVWPEEGVMKTNRGDKIETVKDFLSLFQEDVLTKWQKRFNRRQYPFYLSEEEKKELVEDGVVCLTGASDDLCELDGAVYDEEGLSGRDQICFLKINKSGFNKKGKTTVILEWCKDNYTWLCDVDIQNKRYFDLMEDNDLFCRGCLFLKDDIQ